MRLAKYVAFVVILAVFLVIVYGVETACPDVEPYVKCKDFFD